MGNSGYIQDEVGSDPYISYTGLACGGGVVLVLRSSVTTGWALSRFVQEGPNLVSGVSLLLPPVVGSEYGNAPASINYIDMGDGTPAPLNPSLQYVYQLTTEVGTVQTPPIPVGASIDIVPDDMTYILLRIIGSAISSLRLPSGFKQRPTVSHAMPINGQPTLPLIVVNNSFLGQEEVPIGQQNNDNYLTETNTVTSQAKRVYSVAILTTTVEEREFYRDAVIAIFTSVLGQVFNQIGLNSTHSYVVDSGQVSGDITSPGFFYAEAMLDLTGTYNVIIKANYGLIEHIIPEPTFEQYAIDFSIEPYNS